MGKDWILPGRYQTNTRLKYEDETYNFPNDLVIKNGMCHKCGNEITTDRNINSHSCGCSFNPCYCDGDYSYEIVYNICFNCLGGKICKICDTEISVNQIKNKISTICSTLSSKDDAQKYVIINHQISAYRNICIECEILFTYKEKKLLCIKCNQLEKYNQFHL